MAVVLGYFNQTDDSTLAGGSWSVSYPITNLQNRYLLQKARTSNALATSSVITIDMGSAQTTEWLRLSRTTSLQAPQYAFEG
jgi:hypothetical protein